MPASPPSSLSLPPHLGRRALFRLGLLAVALAGPLAAQAAADPAHTLRITNRSPAALKDYPLQIGQAFMPGEVPDQPQFTLPSGATLPTQAEVTQRWADGSVRFAVLSATLPRVGQGNSLTLGFGSQVAVADPPASVGSLLQQFPDFDARLNFSANGVSHTVSARRMLADNHVQWLARGPQRVALVLADHTGRSQDLGFDGSHKPLRPLFYLDFWPAQHKVRVRAVVESPNLDALQDVRYDVTLTQGRTTPTTVWRKTALSHYFGSRWSKTFWIGGEPAEEVDVRHNLESWSRTGLVPNLRLDATLMQKGIAGWRTAMLSHGIDVYQPGLLTPYMPTTGHRDEIGHMPPWVAAWLKTGDHRLRSISLKNADLADAWPVHFREHNPALFFDRAHEVSAAGRHLSLNAHPGLWFPDNNGVYAGVILPRISDAAGTSGGWVFDAAHQPNLLAEPYMLTGDAYYLDGLQAWAATQAFSAAPGVYGRGVNGYGGLQDQTRGNAWALRNRVLAATLSPDRSAEKRYFYQLVDDMLALWEGQRGVRHAFYADHPNYVWATSAKDYLGNPVAFEWSPLRFWSGRSVVEDSPWQAWFLLAELGFARDLGFPAGVLLRAFAPNLTGQITTAGYEPRLVASYRLPSVDGTGAWFKNWPAVGQAVQTAHPDWAAGALAVFNRQGGPAYAIAATTAASYLTPYPDGSSTWAWLKRNAYDSLDYGTAFAAWRVLPRTSAPPVPPRPSGM